jgi:hypothetical protein
MQPGQARKRAASGKEQKISTLFSNLRVDDPSNAPRHGCGKPRHRSAYVSFLSLYPQSNEWHKNEVHYWFVCLD